jgi:hypothetical protein
MDIHLTNPNYSDRGFHRLLCSGLDIEGKWGEGSIVKPDLGLGGAVYAATDVETAIDTYHFTFTDECATCIKCIELRKPVVLELQRQQKARFLARSQVNE